MSVSTKPYIGTRDFFPDEMAFRSWMFDIQRKICLLYGYSEYAAPILEPLSLYQAKSSEEIVSEQLYRFIDRGDREVAIRPEMTPTLARMVASRIKELPRPIRWFNIGSFMRYERPGRGRLREFYQLNVDLLGVSSAAADAEILMLASDLLTGYGAAPSDFTIRYSDRRLFGSFLKEIPADQLRGIGRLLDKREKIGSEEFDKQLEILCPDKAARDRVHRYLAITQKDLKPLAEKGELDGECVAQLSMMIEILEAQRGKEFLKFDPGIVRGFDYYTGLIFEINDNHAENKRALFGGGRYDRLLGLFGKEQLPAVGFGMGDVTLEYFIDAHNLRPASLFKKSGVYLSLFAADLTAQTMKLAEELRAAGLQAEMSLEAGGKFGRQFEIAEKKNKRYVLILGQDEIQKNIVKVKDLATGAQTESDRGGIVEYLKALPDTAGLSGN